MRALILAAGRGSRMGELTAQRPKALAPLFGKSLLAYQLGALHAGGVDQIAIVTGYRDESIRQEVATLAPALPIAPSFFHNADWNSSNMIGTLRCASHWLQQDRCIVSYSDIVYTAQTVRALATTTHDIAISYDPQALALWSMRFEQPLVDIESFRLGANSTVAEIGRPVTHEDDVEGQFMGLLKLTPVGASQLLAAADNLPPLERARIDSTKLLQRLIEAGHAIGAAPCSGPWGEVDTADDLALYERVLDRGALTALTTPQTVAANV